MRRLIIESKGSEICGKPVFFETAEKYVKLSLHGKSTKLNPLCFRNKIIQILRYVAKQRQRDFWGDVIVDKRLIIDKRIVEVAFGIESLQ